MSYKAANDKKIENAFAVAQRRMNENIMVGMKTTLDAGMQYCLDHHKDVSENGGPHTRHLETKNSYGWVIAYNGMEISRKIHPASGATDEAGRVIDSRADQLLSEAVSKASANGWVGIVLASMEPVGYYRLKDEFKMLRLAISDLKTKGFDTYFTPMSV